MYKIVIKKFITRIENYNPHTNVLGFLRSILALGTLLTLIFNSVDSIFPQELISRFKPVSFFEIINLFTLFGANNVIYSKILAILLLVWIIIGYCPQLNSLIHWWITFSFFNSCLIGDGGDQIAEILCLLLIPLSLLDPRRNHWYKLKKNRGSYINILSYSLVFFIQLQISIIYFHAAIGKINVPEWVDGTAIYYWFNHSVYGGTYWLKYLLGSFLVNPYVTTLLSWGTIVLEIMIFGGLFMSKESKLLLLPVALIFHFMILLIFGLVSFFFSMASALILFLYPLNNHIDKLFKKTR